MKYFSMFTGIGGFENGIERAYRNKQSAEIEQDKERRNGNVDETRRDVRTSDESPLCVGFSEIDKYAIATYSSHFPTHKNYGDATKIIPEELPDFDLICGGFPCQSFSIAGKRMGFEDTRGTLFFDIARIIKVKRPRIVFLENVKGLLNHDNGRTFATILATLDELGYNVEWEVLNSKYFGVPQNRERVFIIGHSREGSSRQIFPLGQGSSWDNEKSTEGERICYNSQAATLKARDYKGGGNLIQQLNQPTHSNDRIYGDKGLSPSLNTMQGGNRQPKILSHSPQLDIPKKKIRLGNPSVNTIQPYLRKALRDSEKTITEIERIFGNRAPHHWFEKIEFASLPDVDDWILLKNILKFDDTFDSLMTEHRLMTDWEIMEEHKERHQKKGNGFGVVELNEEGIANTVTCFIEKTQVINKDSRIRRLTPVECERLQSFPDGWTIGSDSQRYKQCGNAVTVNVIEAIAQRIKEIL